MTNRSENAPDRSAEEKVETLVRAYYELRKSEELVVARKAPRLYQRPIVAAFFIIACAAVWLRPDVLSGGAEAPSAESVERNARLSIYLANLSVRRYRDESGRMPDSLAAAMVNDKSMRYKRLSDSSFELASNIGQRTISYNSSSDIAIFLRSDSTLMKAR